MGNFLVIPLIAWSVTALLLDDPVLRLGALLVLLVPCTDWFISFTHLGKGDTERAVAFAPMSLLLQMLLLPFYLWLFLGPEKVVAVAGAGLLQAFAWVVLVPLIASIATQRLLDVEGWGEQVVNRIAWLPVPLLALVLFLIAAGQVHMIMGATALLGRLVLTFGVFLLSAPLLALILAALVGLAPRRARVLAFSFGSRNSFVVLPVALALPQGYEAAVVVVVVQSLVELFGMLAFVRWIPRIFPEKSQR